MSRFLLCLLVLVQAALPAAWSASFAQTQSSDPAERERRIDAMAKADAKVAQCVKQAREDSRLDVYTQWLANVADPKQPAQFNCGMGASWQDVAPRACCDVWEKSNKSDAAWTELQACGWRNKISVRRLEYLTAAEKCLPKSEEDLSWEAGWDYTNYMNSTPSVGEMARRIIGTNAFIVAVDEAGRLYVIDDAGRRRSMSDFPILGDRVMAGKFALLSEKGILAEQLSDLLQGQDATRRYIAGITDPELAARERPHLQQQYIVFDAKGISMLLPGGQVYYVSAEHSSIRGSINGGGDFIKNDPPQSTPQVLGLEGPSVRVDPDQSEPIDAQPDSGPSAGAAPPPRFAIVMEVGNNGMSAIAVVEGSVRVTERITGKSVIATAGTGVVCVPARGVTRAFPLPASTRSLLAARGSASGPGPSRAAAAPRVFTHASGYQITAPSGWTLDEHPQVADVRLTTPAGDGLIEVSSGPVSVPLDPISYAAGWESRAIGPSQLLKAKRAGTMATIGDRTAYAGTYENAEVVSKVVFLWTPGRFFTFAGTFPRANFAEGEAVFDRLVQSFHPPGR